MTNMDHDYFHNLIDELGALEALHFYFDKCHGEATPSGVLFMMGLQMAVRHPEWAARATLMLNANLRDNNFDAYDEICLSQDSLAEMFPFR